MTGAALEQLCDLGMPVAVRRQAPIVQTVLKGSAAHRQGHQHSCLDAEADHSGAEDSGDHGESTVAVH